MERYLPSLSINRQKAPLQKVLLFFLLLLSLVAPAQAAVTIAFYSRDMHVGLSNIQFPHGFVVLNGMTDAGVPVDANYGFTATEVTPAIMFGPVDGEIIGAKPSYIQQICAVGPAGINSDPITSWVSPSLALQILAGRTLPFGFGN